MKENSKFQIPNYNDQNELPGITQAEVKVEVESPQAFKIKPEGRLIVCNLGFGAWNFP
ncbi:MAG: hypothetical protein GTO45_17955 [Candidatus Aminicenantes bacterium]|nr:hypothetical protein [Candidatus Aminicenantes bacterium]NIM80668.1 hypothetical protein [Candidatus Aminicenantes bacterium]NIN20045.1 hypothetical protein [Candidatus Aminicenantes bacterium]NIN43833.1 hypothetical protein [Candidatus Aminicenantes bacterium]NIN86643.1 hypothetical protein [Candidatus Aminicenantes bacterium]